MLLAIGTGIIQSPVGISREPTSSMMSSLREIVTDLLLNVASHPSSQSWPIDSREWLCKAGNM